MHPALNADSITPLRVALLIPTPYIYTATPIPMSL